MLSRFVILVLNLMLSVVRESVLVGFFGFSFNCVFNFNLVMWL